MAKVDRAPNRVQSLVRQDPRYSSIAVFVSPSLDSKTDHEFMRGVLSRAVLGPKGFDLESNGRIVIPVFQDTEDSWVRDWCKSNELPLKVMSSTGKYAASASTPINDNDLPGLVLWSARRAIFFWDGYASPVSAGLEAAWRMNTVVKMKVFIKNNGKFDRINLKGQ